MPQHPADPDNRPSPPPFPGPAGIADAFRFISHGGIPVGAWAVYLPLVGGVLGALWVAVDGLVGALVGRVGASVALVLVMAAVTRARPLRALARVLVALPGRREERLARLDPGTGRPLAVALVGAAEIALLCALDRFRLVGVAFAPVLGCCAMVVLAVGSRAARQDGRRLKFAPAVGFREFGAASAATFALVFLSTEFLGLLLVLTTAACTIGARVFLHRWIDGVNETAVLATGEAVQLLVIAVLVVL